MWNGICARRKKTARGTESGYPVHSLATLLQAMGTICKNRCRPAEAHTRHG
jgi:hypothetical protein